MKKVVIAVLSALIFSSFLTINVSAFSLEDIYAWVRNEESTTEQTETDKTEESSISSSETISDVDETESTETTSETTAAETTTTAEETTAATTETTTEQTKAAEEAAAEVTAEAESKGEGAKSFNAADYLPADLKATPALWRVTDNDTGNSLYMMGTIHITLDSTFPLPEYIMEVYEASDGVAVEYDIRKIESDFQQIIILSSLLENFTL